MSIHRHICKRDYEKLLEKNSKVILLQLFYRILYTLLQNFVFTLNFLSETNKYFLNQIFVNLQFLAWCRCSRIILVQKCDNLLRD